MVQVNERPCNTLGLELAHHHFHLLLLATENYVAEPRGRELYSAPSGTAFKTSVEGMDPGMSREWGPIMQYTKPKVCLEGKEI